MKHLERTDLNSFVTHINILNPLCHLVVPRCRVSSTKRASNFFLFFSLSLMHTEAYSQEAYYDVLILNAGLESLQLAYVPWHRFEQMDHFSISPLKA